MMAGIWVAVVLFACSGDLASANKKSFVQEEGERARKRRLDGPY